MTGPRLSLADLYAQYQRQQAPPTPTQSTAPPAGASLADLHAQYLAQQQHTAAPAESLGDKLAGFARSVGQGATFGFGDEIEAGAKALLAGSGGGVPIVAPGVYESERDQIRAGQHGYESRHPVASALGEIGGGLATALIPVAGEANAARVAGAGARLGRAAKLGAATGALYGFGKGEGDASAQATSTAGGAAAGWLLGGALQGAGEGVRKIAQATNASPRALNALASLAPGEKARAFLRQRATAALDQASDRNVLERLAQDEVSPAGAAAFLQDAPARIPVAVADAGEENTRQGFAALKRLPGKQKNQISKAVDARDASAPAWVRRSIREHTTNDAGALGLDAAATDTRTANPNTLVQSARDALDARSTARYEPALAGPTTYDAPAAKALGGLLKRPSMQKAVKFGSELAQESGDELPAVVIDAKTGVASGPTARQLHWLKVGLDEHIADLTARSGSGTNMRLRAAMQAKQDLLGVIDKLAPDYAAAMTAHADEVAPITAFTQGRKMPTSTLPEDVETRLADARNANTRTALGAGYARRLGNEVGRAQRQNGNPVKAVVGSGGADDPMVQNLRQLLPSAAPGIEKDAELIARVKRTNTAVKGNSSTTERAMENGAQQKAMIQRAVALFKAAGGRPLSAVQDMLGGTYGPEAEATAAKLLLGVNPGERAAAIHYLEGLARSGTAQRVLRNSRRLPAAGAVGGYTGGSSAAGYTRR